MPAIGVPLLSWGIPWDAADTLCDCNNPAGLILARRELNEPFPKS